LVEAAGGERWDGVRSLTEQLPGSMSRLDLAPVPGALADQEMPIGMITPSFASTLKIVHEDVVATGLNRSEAGGQITPGVANKA
jgi:hypothetical protein